MYASLTDELCFSVKLKHPFPPTHRIECQLLFSDHLLILCHLLPMKHDSKESNDVASLSLNYSRQPLLPKCQTQTCLFPICHHNLFLIFYYYILHLMNSKTLMKICIGVNRHLNHYFLQSRSFFGHAIHPDELSNKTSFPGNLFIFTSGNANTYPPYFG